MKIGFLYQLNINFLFNPVECIAGCNNSPDFFIHKTLYGSRPIPKQKLANKYRVTNRNVCGIDQIEVLSTTNPTTKTDINTIPNLESGVISKTFRRSIENSN